MSDATVAVAEVGTRQAMIRVWMAISAIWVAFWLAIAALVVVTGEVAGPLADMFRLFALIVLTPPLGLLAVGVLSRYVFETLFRRHRSA